MCSATARSISCVDGFSSDASLASFISSAIAASASSYKPKPLGPYFNSFALNGSLAPLYARRARATTASWLARIPVGVLSSCDGLSNAPLRPLDLTFFVFTTHGFCVFDDFVGDSHAAFSSTTAAESLFAGVSFSRGACSSSL